MESEVLLYKCAVIISSFAPISMGLFGFLIGPQSATLSIGSLSSAQSQQDYSISLDCHYRYLSGLLLGIGLLFLYLVTRVLEKETNRILKMLTFIVVLGGCGRLLSLGGFYQGQVKSVNGKMLLGLFMELVVTPTLYMWHNRIMKITDTSTKTKVQ
ncbi:unnamed protein product [Adineta steineri]|uniref:DUF4345 domain-containing protein n=1 Tax=Adineta steineri TaxID=433720 RepID=A0A815C8M4_9BILA|nr:unnamed protein product [Adineta steineri]CAF1280694.1 unnamed protein product [Adineta steineri]